MNPEVVARPLPLYLPMIAPHCYFRNHKANLLYSNDFLLLTVAGCEVLGLKKFGGEAEKCREEISAPRDTVAAMKFSIPITCQCGQQLTLHGSGTQPIADEQCPECHSPILVVPGLADEVAIRILHRAFTDLQNGDFTLTIVLGAMAVECELSYLFIKWQKIDFSRANSSDPTAAQEEAWVEQWSKLRAIKKRLDTISKLLTKEPFDSFVSHNASLLKSVFDKYPICKTHSSTKEFLQKEFFDRRNRIVHYGQVDFQQNEAEMCAAIALSLLRTLKAMDTHRYKDTFK